MSDQVTNRDWSEEEEILLKELRPRHTITELHQIFRDKGFRRSKVAIERKAARLGVFFKGKILEPAGSEKNQYKRAWDKIIGLKEEYKETYEHRQTGVMPVDQAKRKILSISDFHIPFDRDDLIMEVIKKHKDADICVVNGDMLDLHAVSTWPKERSIILRKEYEIAMEYLKVLSSTFPHVILVRGNHEYRLNRYFHSNVSKDISFMVNKEILGRLASGEEYDDEGNVTKRHDFSNVHYASGHEAWFVKVGKTMFLHPQAFSKTEAKTVISAQEYFMERTDIDCIVTGHTHHIASVPSRNKLCLEQGCLCCPLDYEKQGKLNYKAMVLGYAVVYQDEEGNCDFNKTRFYYLGTQYPIKRDFDDMIAELEEKQGDK